MTEFLIRYFVKDYEDVEKVSVRTAYGMLSGIVGIFCNVILFLTKLIVGLVLNSVSVMADAFNNLSDAGSSVISLWASVWQESRRTKIIRSGMGGSST